MSKRLFCLFLLFFPAMFVFQACGNICEDPRSCGKIEMCENSKVCVGKCNLDSDCPEKNKCSNVACVPTEHSQGQIDRETTTEPCKEGMKRSCHHTQHRRREGICLENFQRCTNGKWTSCISERKPSTEVCDGKDNDCDGQVDEQLKKTCGSNLGECQEGYQLCSQGNWGECQEEKTQSTEVCDGKDNDCNGIIDDYCKKKECVLESKKPLDFGEAIVGKTLSRTLTITNKGNMSCLLHFHNINDQKPSSHGSFKLEKAIHNEVIEPQKSLLVTIHFTPSGAGSFESSFVTGSAKPGPGSYSLLVTLKGKALAP